MSEILLTRCNHEIWTGRGRTGYRLCRNKPKHWYINKQGKLKAMCHLHDSGYNVKRLTFEEAQAELLKRLL